MLEQFLLRSCVCVRVVEKVPPSQVKYRRDQIRRRRRRSVAAVRNVYWSFPITVPYPYPSSSSSSFIASYNESLLHVVLPFPLVLVYLLHDELLGAFIQHLILYLSHTLAHTDIHTEISSYGSLEKKPLVITIKSSS